MRTHEGVYAVLRGIFPAVQQKAGEYLKIDLSGDEYVILCSPEGKYASRHLTFRAHTLPAKVAGFAQVPEKPASNKYYMCKVTDWDRFYDFVMRHAAGGKKSPGRSLDTPNRDLQTTKPEIAKSAEKSDAAPPADADARRPRRPEGAPALFRQIITCRACRTQGIPGILCDDGYNLPQPGYVGRNYPKTRVLLVAQNPGDCPEGHRFRALAEEYSRLVSMVGKHGDSTRFDILQEFLAGFIPQWPLFSKIPLAEAGLGIHDIAYINLVHCRTKDNIPVPPAASRNCIAAHFADTLDTLRPKAVISLGKWTHEQISHLLHARSLPHAFINRQRNLSHEQRNNNRNEVVSLLQSIGDSWCPYHQDHSFD